MIIYFHARTSCPLSSNTHFFVLGIANTTRTGSSDSVSEFSLNFSRNIFLQTKTEE